MTDPVEMYFPQRALERAKTVVAGIAESDRHTAFPSLEYLRICTTEYKKRPYGFRDYLFLDNYAPSTEELEQHVISQHNCTTLIPYLYQLLEAQGMEPEIVQFIGFQDITLKKKNTENTPVGEHFAIVVKVNKKGIVREYLTDPFWSVCGEIVEKTDTFWKIKGYGGFASLKREFDAVLCYTKEEFAQMLYEVRDDGKSLDVLIAGQKIREDHAVAKANCNLMLYYNDETNALTTRLYVPQVGITDKVLHCAQYFDAQGRPQREELTFSLASNCSWHSLAGERRVAVTDYKTIKQIKRVFGRRIRFDAYPRMETLLDALELAPQKRTLLEIADALYAQLPKDHQIALRPLVLVRTLYEAEAPDREYVYDEQKRDQRIKHLLEQNLAYKNQLQVLEDIISIATWNLSDTSKENLREMKRKKNTLAKKRQALKFPELNSLRIDNSLLYHRTMDKVLFAQQYEHTSADELERLAKERGPDWRVGYLAMVTDFFPYAFEARSELELDLFRDSLHRRVKARCAQRAA